MFKRNHHYLEFLLLACVFSRVLTSIYYIEDIDSLRFALSIQDYNILSLQPHFPGYPVFCFFAKYLHVIIGNMGVVFSIIGGLSIFFIIYYLLRIFNANLRSYEGQYIALIIFFNPLFWIMSNRYMPDLMGLATSLGAIYYLIFAHKQGRHLEKGFFISGILSGIRLSYLPLLIFPICKILFQSKDRLKLLVYFSVGVFIWMIPMITITGFNDLIEIAQRHTAGHFLDYGGTILTEQSFPNRIIHLFRSVWADGFGGYWIGRGSSSILLSVLLLVQFATSASDIRERWNRDNKLKNLLFCIIIYTVWIILFQNVIFKSRHILPVLLFFCILLIEGQERIKGRQYLMMVYCYFIILAGHNYILIDQHRNYTAIHKLKSYVSNKNNVGSIISIPLINYYLERHNVSTKFVSVEDSSEIKNFSTTYDSSKQVIMVGDYQSLLNDTFISKTDTTFYHNPYMNQMWPKIQVYSIKKNSQYEIK